MFFSLHLQRETIFLTSFLLLKGRSPSRRESTFKRKGLPQKYKMKMTELLSLEV